MKSLAGVLGGSDSLHVTPFDETFRRADEFSQRIARNQQLMLRHECKLDALIDPAGGSWYVETLTDWLARQAWAAFQAIEAQGGMLAALQAGTPQAQVAEIAQQRTDNLYRRKDVLVGVNMYANPQPDLPADSREIRASRPPEHSPLTLAPDDFGAAVEAAQAGATLSQISRAIRANAGPGSKVEPLNIHRLAEGFEQLQQAAQDYELRTGKLPQIFLAQLGDSRARAAFTARFFEVGGFEILDRGVFELPQAAAEAALKSGAGAVAICSTDAAYPEIVPPLVQAIKSAKPDAFVVLAGYPQAQIEAHRAAGIDDFIHIRSNCYEMNLKVQQQIGVQA